MSKPSQAPVTLTRRSRSLKLIAKCAAKQLLFVHQVGKIPVMNVQTLVLLLQRSRSCEIFSPVSKAKSAVCRSVSTGPQSFLWSSTGLGHVWRLKVSKVGQDCRMWLGV